MHYQTTLKTALGDMIAIANDEALLVLEFSNYVHLSRLLSSYPNAITKKDHPVLMQIAEELSLYFNKQLTEFKTPIAPEGTPFQTTVWRELARIPYGKTCSYGDMAKALKRPTAQRAVAKANSTNPLAIIIPCHRVIRQNGELSGYASGVDKKAWLLKHEGLI